MSITNLYGDDGLIRTEYQFQVSGSSHADVMQRAHDQAKALFGHVPFVLRSVEIRPAIQDVMGNAVVFFADVEAVVDNTNSGPDTRACHEGHGSPLSGPEHSTDTRDSA